MLDLKSWIEGHGITEVECLVPDMNGVLRKDPSLEYTGGGLALPVWIDFIMPSMMRTSISPSSPEGSGWRLFRMQSEKYSSSGAN